MEEERERWREGEKKKKKTEGSLDIPAKMMVVGDQRANVSYTHQVSQDL